MKNKICTLKRATIVAIMLVFTGVLCQEGETSDVPKGLPKSGDIIPAFSIPAPKSKLYRSYLGLAEENNFKPAGLEAKMIIIEVLNLY